MAKVKTPHKRHIRQERVHCSGDGGGGQDSNNDPAMVAMATATAAVTLMATVNHVFVTAEGGGVDFEPVFLAHDVSCRTFLLGARKIFKI